MMTVRAEVVRDTEGNIDGAANGPGSADLAGVKERGASAQDSPGTWEISMSPRRRAVGGRGMRSPAGEVHPPTLRSNRMHSRYCRAKATKRGGTGVEKSERAVVLTRAGNRTAGTRRREGLAVAWNCCEDR